MALDLTQLLDPKHTAIITQEVQRGVVGDLSQIPDLAAAAAPACRTSDVWSSPPGRRAYP